MDDFVRRHRRAHSWPSNSHKHFNEEPTVYNIPADIAIDFSSEIVMEACADAFTAMTETTIIEIHEMGVNGWWLVVTIAVAIMIIVAHFFLSMDIKRRTLEALRNVPAHKLHEKLEEEEYRATFVCEINMPSDYRPKTYKGGW